MKKWKTHTLASFLTTMRAGIRPDIPVLTFERHVNDPAFGVEVAEVFVGMMEKARQNRQLMEFLDRRAADPRCIPLADAKTLLRLDTKTASS